MPKYFFFKFVINPFFKKKQIQISSRYMSYGLIFQNGYDAGAHEIDFSSTVCAFTVLIHQKFSEKENQLKGGDTICFLHRELDCYLTAEGVFTDSQIIEEVHLRERYRSKAHESNLTANNASCFWQV